MDNKGTKPVQEGSARADESSTVNRSKNRIDDKIRIIRFILLSAVLYLITDAIGRWFLTRFRECSLQ